MIVLWLAVAEVVFLIVVLTASEKSPNDHRLQPEKEGILVQHENELASYSVSYPEQWNAEDDGSLTTAFSPDRHAVVSVGVGPEGSLFGVADAIVDLARQKYRRLQIKAARTDFIDGKLAITREGSAFNASGVRISWFAAAVEHTERNFAITAFWSENHGVRRRILKVIKSFDILDH